MPGQQPGQPAQGSKSTAPAVVTRPAKASRPADPAELKAGVDGEGKVRFNFQGQPWPDVLEWLAKVSSLSLDWQELPGDHLNLRTQRAYTLDEARDLINRHLLDRGFTLLKNGEVLTVANLKKLDPSLVPRVAPEDLGECRPHEFVKVSFQLKSLVAEPAVEEIKPMLSPNGKASALKGTNRIEVLDAAANLQEVAAVLATEQNGGAPKRIVREFRLEHRKAAEVHEMLKSLLGLDTPPQPGMPQNPQQQQEQMMAMQMAAMQHQGGQPPQPQPQNAAPKVRLVVNTRDNSILAHAPADQMAVIAEAVETVDVPSEKASSLLKNLNRMQVYRLNSLDCEALVKVLQEMGDLDPATTLKADKANRSIVAYATLADHLTIRTLVEKLDGTGRRFEVVRLRRLEADYVAGTIEFLMSAGDRKKQPQRRMYYDFMPWGMGPQQDDGDDSKKFRVDADVEHNRLLLFANDAELKEVHNLLVKLGEIPSENETPRTYRILDVTPEEGDELLRRLKDAWPSVSPNPLELPKETPAPEAGEGEDEVVPPAKKIPAKPATGVPPKEVGQVSAKVLEVAQADDEELETPSPRAEEQRADAPRAPGRAAPVRVRRGADGRIVLHSEDTDALDQLEELSQDLTPPRKDYKLFPLKYSSTWAYGVVLNLREFFEEQSKDDRRERQMGWFMGFGAANERDTTRRLSKRRALKFISDSDTNSILVVGADPQQLKIIEELIEMYDQPPANEKKSVRKTQLFTLKYSKARVVAEAIKDVYRDLLSVNDRAMQANAQSQNGNQNQRPPSERSYTFIYGSGDEEDGEKPETPIKFKGLLSLGVDEDSNTLIVSAAEGLLENVAEMIQSLEDAARPRAANVQVLTLSGRVNSSAVQEKLQKLLGRPAVPPQQGQVPAGQQPGQGQPIQPQQGLPQGTEVKIGQ